MNGRTLALCAGLMLALPRAGLGQGEADLASLLDRIAPSIVTVKVVIKTEISMMGQAQNEESRSELPGVVVDDSGLVMISNAEISADRVKEAALSVGGCEAGAGGPADGGQHPVLHEPVLSLSHES